MRVHVCHTAFFVSMCHANNLSAPLLVSAFTEVIPAGRQISERKTGDARLRTETCTLTTRVWCSTSRLDDDDSGGIAGIANGFASLATKTRTSDSLCFSVFASICH